jgi:hypothetical protein
LRRWLTDARRNWDAILALVLGVTAIGAWLGPGYYFLTLWILLSLYVLKVALDTPSPPRRR